MVALRESFETLNYGIQNALWELAGKESNVLPERRFSSYPISPQCVRPRLIVYMLEC
jgi:hypothetical protein